MAKRASSKDEDAAARIEVAATTDLAAAIENFAHYRVLMNPRFTLKDKWFPRSLAYILRKFYDDFKAGKRPVLLLQTPPQHGKSLSVIDFIAWAVGHDPELRLIYASFSDRLSIRANLRVQRALDNPLYQFLFPQTQIAPKGSGVALRNYDILEFIGTDGYFRNSTVLGSITGEALDIGVIDDPIKGRAEANSELQREKVWNWLTDDVFSRFSEHAGLLMIMTRWHVDDPAGRLIDKYGDRVRVARFPAIAEEKEKRCRRPRRTRRYFSRRLPRACRLVLPQLRSRSVARLRTIGKTKTKICRCFLS